MRIARIYWRLQELRDASKNARAHHSAHYILDGVDPVKLSELTGLPIGVITAAYDNIFWKEKKEL